MDQDAVPAAIGIRQTRATRLPLVDALIAGCAAARGLTLAQRDRPMDAIPAGEAPVLHLPDREIAAGAQEIEGHSAGK